MLRQCRRLGRWIFGERWVLAGGEVGVVGERSLCAMLRGLVEGLLPWLEGDVVGGLNSGDETI